MRILAIRGENLASLAGPFALELGEGPLAAAGLFAITGPTGAGKSTILDALCLALFNAMPRLPGGTAVYGRDDDPDQISISDPRGILRRGAASAYAEVEFEGIDGGRYRARWQVRRARDKADGRLQPVRMALAQTGEGRGAGDGMVLAEGTSAVLEAVEQKLGLSFAQFRRTVLLAQGDFAGFLKAKGSERAEILARLTGTGIYAQISRLAYRRAAEERERLRQIEEGLGQIERPDAAREAEAAEALARAQAAGALLEQRLDALGRDLAWHDQADALARRITLQDQAVGAAAAAHAALAREEQELASYDRLQPLAVPLAALERAEAGLKAAEDRLQRDLAGLAAARDAVAAAESRAATAAAALAEADSGLEALQPRLIQARALDVQLAGLAEQRQRAEAELARLSTALAEAESALETRREALARDRTALAEATAWLDTAGPRRALAEGWPRWSELLAQAARTRQALLRTEAAQEQAQAARDAAARPVLERRSSALELEQVLARAEAQLAAAPAPTDTTAACAKRQAAARSLDDLQRAEGIATALASAGASLARAEEGLAVLQARAVERTQALPRLAEALAGAQGELRGLRRVLDAYAAADGRDAQALRSNLVEGAPCPVCGSTTHPLREGEGDPDPRRAALAREQEELDARVAALVGRKAALEAEAAADADSAMRLAREQADTRAELSRLEQEWQALLPQLPDGLAQPAALETALVAARDHLLRCQREEEQAIRAAARRADALAAVTAATTAHGRARSALAEAEAALAAANGRLEALQAEMERLRSDAAEQGRALAEGLAPVPGWERRLAADPTSLAAELDGWVHEHAAMRQRQAELSGRLALDQAGLDEQRRLCAAVTADRRSAADSATGLNAQWSSLREHRLAVLGDDDPADREATARHTVERARQAAAEAHAALARSREMLAQAEGNAVASRQAREAAEQALAGAMQGFSHALAPTGRSRGEVAALLGRGSSWAEDLRVRVSTARRALEEAQSVLADRRRQAEDHAAAARPAEDRPAVLSALEEVRRTLEAERERAQAARLLLQRQADAKAAAARIGQRLHAQQEKVQIWGSLAEVIGSANGARFQNYAQALSLDVLLQEANHHLALLAPRYRLERTRAGNDPGSLEIQVVDRDMALEVRSVHSLSGGESFLVSLALALGLSGLVGGGAAIGTLFIDEGFGALDPGSLDLAISCLETLQASGRQIGVISHVEALNERLGIQVLVERSGSGRSRIRIRDAVPALH